MLIFMAMHLDQLSAISLKSLDDPVADKNFNFHDHYFDRIGLPRKTSLFGNHHGNKSGPATSQNPMIVSLVHERIDTIPTILAES